MLSESAYDILTCDYCSSEIINSPLYSMNGERFCDVVCAKLYNDNIEPIDINIEEYNQLYNHNLLSESAKDIWNKLGFINFKLLPRYIVNSDSDNGKIQYLRVISNLNLF
jgi:hypothetical protein